ncbi:MAG: YncE family protein, partial [Thermoplasmata archaeon]
MSPRAGSKRRFGPPRGALWVVVLVAVLALPTGAAGSASRVHPAASPSSGGELGPGGTLEALTSATPGAVPTDGPNAIYATIDVGLAPDAGAYDSSNGYLYFANAESNNISVIDSASSRAIASISVEEYPDGITYDSANGNLFVSNYGTYSNEFPTYSNVSVIYGGRAGA